MKRDPHDAQAGGGARVLAGQRQVPVLIVAVVLVAVLVGGAAAGALLARWLAPDAPFVELLSFLMLPAALVVGFHAWLGAAVLLLLPRLAERATRPPTRRPVYRSVPPGSWTFLPVGFVFGLMGGLIAGVFSSSLIAATFIYGLAGTVYGALLWRLARRGYLPFPDSA